MSAHLRTLEWTLEEFLDWERRQEERWEFDGIQPLAMTGGSLRHSELATNLVQALRERLKRPCRVFRGDVKIRTVGKRIRYPDAVISCTDPLPETSDILPGPIVVFEVLSPSTETFDRTIKAAEYFATSTIQAYVMLSQDEPEATVLRRDLAGGPPSEEEVAGIGASIALPEVGVAALPLAAIHARD